MDLICALLRIYFLVILASIISSWIPTSEGTLPDKVKRGVNSLTEPVFRPIRALLPPVQMGSMGLDLSPLIVIIGLQIVLAYLCP